VSVARPTAAPSASGPTPRAQPFLCPYCGEEELRPAEEAHGAYHCRACDRRFSLRFLGLGPGETLAE
jgi:hypothetical protein